MMQNRPTLSSRFMRSIFSALLLFAVIASRAQSVPWESPLNICTGTSPTAFGTATLFQDSSGVPTVIRLGSPTSDTLIAAFQWFPAPLNSTYWDKIAVKFSYDGGASWTTPVSCVFNGLPVGNQRPFDPSLIQLSNGQIRMYFSGGVNNPPMAGIDTYSAISSDGINYTVESGVRFNNATMNAIDPSVAEFNGTYYYNSWTNQMSDGANRASATDGLNFTTQAMLPFDGTHLWLGNYMLDDTTLRFYGCGNSGMWMNSTTDGSTWAGYTMMPGIMGADPAVVKNQAGTYILIYTGPPSSTGIKSGGDFTASVTFFPNPANEMLQVLVSEQASLQFFNTAGQCVKTVSLNAGRQAVGISQLAAGVYFLKFNTENGFVVYRFIKK